MKQKCWYEMSLPRKINYPESLFLTLSRGRNMWRGEQLPCKVWRLRRRNGPNCIWGHPFTSQTVQNHLLECILVHFSSLLPLSPGSLSPSRPTKRKKGLERVWWDAEEEGMDEWESPPASGLLQRDPRTSTNRKFLRSLIVMTALPPARLPSLFSVMAPYGGRFVLWI